MLKGLRHALRPRWRWLLLLYVVLMLASTGVRLFSSAPAPPGQPSVSIPTMLDDGPLQGRSTRLSYKLWPANIVAPRPNAPDRLPVLLLHGSPGSSAAFAKLAPLLAQEGRSVYAIDLPGFGESDIRVPDYSILADARSVLAFMDESSIPRAHLVGWSLGGGVALEAIDIAPARFASLTMLASIGTQEAEGSGDYYFEHAKYALGYALLVVAPEAIPHFGLFGSFWQRHAFIRSFWDTDQRPLSEVMQRIHTPTLIIHGRHDFLVAAWGAELNHELIPTSRLVMLDASHFLPFLQQREITRHIAPFLALHDDPAALALHAAADYAPAGAGANKVGPFKFEHPTPWWLLILLIVLATFISEDATVIGVGILVAQGSMDFGVGLMGCMIGIGAGDAGLWMIGRFAGRRALRWPVVRAWLPERALERWGHSFDKHAVKAVMLARAVPGTRVPMYLSAGLLSQRAHRFLLWAALAVVLWTPLLLILAAFIGPPILSVFHQRLGGTLALLVAVLVLFLAMRVAILLPTHSGRLKLLTAIGKPTRPEFWPMWFFYAPVVPWLGWLSLRHRGPMTFTCLNPGIPCGGGVIGESKDQILSAIISGGAADWIVTSRLIPAGPLPAARADQVESLVQSTPALAGYPIVLKPDEAQRGHAFRLIKNRDDAHEYFRTMTRAALLQRYHPGPEEAGILWSRIPGAPPDAAGQIVSITRKVFPIMVGDGVRTLEDLIWASPRYRMQAHVFLKRFEDQVDRIPAAGERIRLAIAGNHCQGTMFLDGADLITPALTQRIDSIARSFPRAAFDYGRFDVRYTTDDALRNGEGFTIVELNGTLSESTNLYDPSKSIFWSYSVLFRQWTLMYRLGAERRARGGRPMTLREFLHAYRDHFQGRRGSSISD